MDKKLYQGISLVVWGQWWHPTQRSGYGEGGMTDYPGNITGMLMVAMDQYSKGDGWSPESRKFTQYGLPVGAEPL